MKKSRLLVLVLTFVAIACNKDKFTTEPKVEVKSISPSTVSNGDIIVLNSKYTDDEGDVDTALVVYKWYNGSTAVKNDTFKFTFGSMSLPAGLRQAELAVTFEYNTNNNSNLMSLPGLTLRDTTASFGLILIDKKGHRSNYSESSKIRLKKT